VTSVFSLIEKRHSVRSFRPHRLSLKEEAKIQDLLKSPLVAGLDQRLDWKLKLNTPVGSGKLYTIVPDRRPEVLVAYGFQGQNLLLKLVALGYGTCWLGVGRAMEKNSPAVIVFGYEGPPNLVAWASRIFLRPGQRRPLASLLSEASLKPSSNLLKVLHAMRLAPSAVNRQPWRFTVKGDYKLEVRRTGGHPVWSYLDLGIVLCHGYLASQEVFGDAEVERINTDTYQLVMAKP